MSLGALPPSYLAGDSEILLLFQRVVETSELHHSAPSSYTGVIKFMIGFSMMLR